MIETKSSRQANSRAQVREMSRAKIKSRQESSRQKIASRGTSHVREDEEDLPRWNSSSALMKRGDSSPHKYRNQLTSPNKSLVDYSAVYATSFGSEAELASHSNPNAGSPNPSLGNRAVSPTPKSQDPMKQEQIRILLSQQRKRQRWQKYPQTLPQEQAAIQQSLLKKITAKTEFPHQKQDFVQTNPGPKRSSGNTPQESFKDGDQFEVVQFEGGKLADELEFTGTLGFNNSCNSRGLPSRGGLQTRGGDGVRGIVSRGSKGEDQQQPFPMPGDRTPSPAVTPQALVRSPRPAKRAEIATPSTFWPQYRAATPMNPKPGTFENLRGTCSRSHTRIHVGTERPPYLPLLKSRRESEHTGAKAEEDEEKAPPAPELKYDKNIFMQLQQERNSRRNTTPQASSLRPTRRSTTVSENDSIRASMGRNQLHKAGGTGLSDESLNFSDPAELQQRVMIEVDGCDVDDTTSSMSTSLSRTQSKFRRLTQTGQQSESELSKTLTNNLKQIKTPAELQFFPSLNNVPQAQPLGRSPGKQVGASGGRSKPSTEEQPGLLSAKEGSGSGRDGDHTLYDESTETIAPPPPIRTEGTLGYEGTPPSPHPRQQQAQQPSDNTNPLSNAMEASLKRGPSPAAMDPSAIPRPATVMAEMWRAKNTKLMAPTAFSGNRWNPQSKVSVDEQALSIDRIRSHSSMY